MKRIVATLAGFVSWASVARGEPAPADAPVEIGPDDAILRAPVSATSRALALPLAAERLDDGAERLGTLGTGDTLALVSRSLTGRGVEALAATGTYATRRLVMRATDREGPVGVELSGEVLATDGYAPVAPAQRGAVDGAAPSTRRDLAARLEHVAGSSTVRAFGRWADSSAGTGTPYQDLDLRTVTYGVRWTLDRPEGRLELTAFGSDQLLHGERAHVTPDRSAAALAGRQTAPSNSQGARLALTSRPLHGLGEHVVTIGGDVLLAAGTVSENANPAMQDDMTLLGRDAGGAQEVTGAFVEDALHTIESLDLDGALRLDRYTIRHGFHTTTIGGGAPMTVASPDASQLQLGPSVGATVRLTEELGLRAAGYRGFRAPTLDELYRPIQIGTISTDANEALRAETIWGAELGPRLVTGPLVARASGFWEEVGSPIEDVTLATATPDGATRQRQNLGHARITGLDLATSWRPSRAWLAAASYTLSRSEITDAPQELALVGRQLARTPRQRATALVRFDEPSLATITVEVRYLDRQYQDDRNTLALDAHAIVDVFVGRRLGHGVSGFVTVENLLDRRYLADRSGIDTLGPPRLVMVGLRLDTAR